MTSSKFVLPILINLVIGTCANSVNAALATNNSGKTKIEPTPKLSVDFDTTGIAKSTKVEIVPTSPYEPDDTIWLSAEPMHTRIIFDGKKVESDNDFNLPHLLVYPIKEWAAMFPPDKKKIFDKRIGDLKKMIASKSDAKLAEMPTLPDSDGAELLHSQVKFVPFKSGTGMSFINVHGNGDGPYNAGDFSYAFQGITSDGKYYVSFFWPVKAPGLPPQSGQKKTEAFLTHLPRAKFSPSLDLLDHVSSSISIK